MRKFILITILCLSFFSSKAQQKNIFIDKRDDQAYKQIQIGIQVWMAENLNYKTDNSFCYNNNPDNSKKYGRLYTWEAAQNACPDGWHLPTDKEWKQLEKFSGMSQSDVDASFWRGSNEGTKLKATNGWLENGNGSNDYGFAMLPGGYRSGIDSTFKLINEYGYCWTSTELIPGYAWYRRFCNKRTNILRYTNYMTIGYSIRCIKDN
jgi:uncharacterized protein (TIGR02145 family)